MQKNLGISLVVWNGEKTIKTVLQSLLNQTYSDFKIFILDNRSTDKTISIVKKLQKKDKRINLIIDKIQRNGIEATNLLFKKNLKRFKYTMFASDDDFYHHEYIEKNIEALKKNHVDMSYSFYNLIYGNKKFFFTKNFPIYEKKNSTFVNLIKFLIYRNVVPVFFGIYKTKKLIKSFKYFKTYDTSNSNYDNLTLLHFFLNNKVNCIKEILFSYRIKNRSINYISNDNKYSKIIEIIKNFSKIFLYQLNFSVKVFLIITKSKKINFLKKNILYFLILLLYFQKTIFFITKKMLNRHDKYKK